MSHGIQGWHRRLSSVPATGRVGRLLRLPLRLLPGGLRVPVLSGPLRGAWWITGTSTHGAWLGSYEHAKQIAIWRSLSPGDVFYDVGAHVGFYTLLAGRRVGATGAVCAFEPLPGNLQLLRRHVELNRLENVTLYAGVASDVSGRVGFGVGPGTALGRIDEGSTERVDAYALDDLVAAGEIPPPDVIKIDVEGAEGRVLRGSLATLERHGPRVFVAVHGGAARDECSGILRRLSYSVETLGGEPVEGLGELLAEPPAPRSDSDPR